MAARWGDLGVRALSAVVLIPVVVILVWAGGIWFSLLMGLVGVFVALEWTTMTHRQHPLQFALHGAAGLCGAFLPLEAGIEVAMAAVASLWIISAAVSWFEEPRGPAWRYFGVPYVAVPPAAVVLLRHDTAYGVWAILWILIIVWAADTLAYFAGRLIGGPKLAPVISPKKTWAGLGGAIIGGAFASIVFGAVAGLDAIFALAALAGFLAVVGQAGDLFKSALKRHYGVKDSGSLIPGHGGIIDRVDGIVAVGTVAMMIGLARSGLDATGTGLLLW